MPLVVEFVAIVIILAIFTEAFYAIFAFFAKKKVSIYRKLIQFISIFIVFIVFFAHFFANKVAIEYFGAKDIVAKLSPKWLPSDQPDIVRLDKKEKYILYAYQAPLFTNILLSNIIHFPEFAYDYLFGEKTAINICKNYFGISIDPVKNDIKQIMPKLKDLGAKSVLIRINYQNDIFNKEDYVKNINAAKELKKNGYEILLVVAQNRDIFTDNINFNAFFEHIFTDFSPYVLEYQIGETINRPKWGILTLGEYESFFDAAKNARDKIKPDAKLIAPSVIDFEWLYTIYYVNAIKDYDILNSLLYVDRVGQPENTQMGSDTIDKIRIMQAIDNQKPFYITEFNWPLSGTGDFKPTSDAEAVDEYMQAVYNTRYALLAIGSNYTNKIYYWQLYANGYGLIDHLTNIEKPSFKAYKTLIKTFSGSKDLKLSKIDEKCYILEDENGTKAYWCTANTNKKLELKEKVKYYDMFGAVVINPTLGIAPIYAIR